MRRLSTEDLATDDLAGREQPGSTVPGFAAFERIPGAVESGLILICDHASNALPPGYGSLGLPRAELDRHIGYDIGAAGVTRMLAHRLGCPALLTRFSRLLIDPNRGEDDPTLVMRLSDGAVIPGNRHAADDEIERRLARFHRPYHAAVDAEIDAALERGIVPAIFSMHSFTPVWRGVARPWHAAVLWDSDPRLSRELIDGLRAPGDLIVGDNEPYDGALRGDCLFRHGTLRGLAHTLLEIRQDLIAEEDGQRRWADRLAGLLPALLARPELHEVRSYGSRTGPVPPI